MDERLGAMMAIKEFNAKGGVLGRPIEAIHMDSETTPATGSRVAERLITRNEVAYLVGALHSGVANAISQVAQKYGCIYLNTNSSSPTEAGKDCHRVKFVWDGNGTNFALAIVKNAMAVNGKNWVMLTNDYVWGHRRQRRCARSSRPMAARSSRKCWCRRTRATSRRTCSRSSRSSRAVVAAAVGGDDIKSLRQQVVQLKMNKSPAWINNQQDWPDVYGLGPDAIFGVFGTNWYYRLDLPGVKEFVAAYQTTYPGVQIKVPGNTYYNGYMATRELLRATERAGSTNNIKVIKELENLKVSRARPDAGLRRVHESGHAPDAADDLHGDVQRHAGGKGRHLQDPCQAAAEGSRGSGRSRRLQARVVRRDADVRAVTARHRRARRALHPLLDAASPRSSRCRRCCPTSSTARRSGCCSR